ncbi:MAG TPA: SEC-C metal-binding domain-containing protein [Vicinamibacteria bacterium]|nr:SEC-C metal-binding domain-containing protein [Vicinamibacteria bacterium]
MPAATIGRNDPCHCGSGKKYKQCHLDADEVALREARAKEAGAEPSAEGVEPERAAAVPRPERPHTQQPWKRSGQNTRGFHKHTAPRKVGGS